jgi:hypothetical protein
MKWNEFFLWISFVILMFVLLHLFTWVVWVFFEGGSTVVVPVSVEAPPPAWAPLSKKRKRCGKALQGAITRRAPRSANVRGRGWGSTKFKTNRVLLDIEAGTSDELPLVIKQSFKDGNYCPSTGMEEREWQIMLEQFIVSGVVVKNEIININSDWICLFCFCNVFLFVSFGCWLPWHLRARCILDIVTGSLILFYYFCTNKLWNCLCGSSTWFDCATFTPFMPQRYLYVIDDSKVYILRWNWNVSPSSSSARLAELAPVS